MIKIAIQGGTASFHDIAAQQFFKGQQIDTKTYQCATFRELCERLKDKSADYAVMAIENSIAATILGNYSLLQEYGFWVMGEIQLRIEMNLIGLPGSKEKFKNKEITRVMSHYMALYQCEDFFLNHPFITEKEEYHDTADSVKYVKEHQLKDTAGIASRYAAEVYGMEVIEAGIETNKQNFTRFLVLSRDKVKNEEANKATISFRLPHRVGSLVEVLQLIVTNNVNLTKIQSLPILGVPNEYTFYVECEWMNYNDWKKCIGINSIVRDLKILGEYKKGEMIHDYSGR